MTLRTLLGGVAAAAVLGAGMTIVVAAPAHAAVARSTIVAKAQAELNDTSRKSPSASNGDGQCNYYTGYFRTWKSSSNCPTTSGVKWRGSNWCADFVKYVWKTSGVTYADIAETNGGALTGWASSIKDYGVKYNTWHTRGSGYTPQPGDALVFDWEGD